MADAALTKIAGAPLAGLHLDGGLGAGCGGSHRLVQRLGERQALLFRLLQGGQSGPPGVTHGLVTRLGAAAGDDPLHPVAQHLAELAEGQALAGIAAGRGPDEEGAVEGSAGATDRGEQRHAGGFEHLAYVLVRHRGQLLRHLGKAALHVEAVIAVADVGIQRREVVTLLGEDVLAVEQPVDDLMLA